MQSMKCVPICASLLVALVGGAHSAIAQTQNLPWIQMESMSFNLGIGGQSGDGVLHLPNLGTNCEYPFKVEGFGAGIQVGISKVSASGPVANLARVSDLSGDYGATEGEVTLLAGAGGSSLKNAPAMPPAPMWWSSGSTRPGSTSRAALRSTSSSGRGNAATLTSGCSVTPIRSARKIPISSFPTSARRPYAIIFSGQALSRRG